MTRLLVVLALSMPFAAQAATNEAQALWDRASQDFQGGKYDDAAAAYQQLISSGVDNADVYFNLGTAQLRARHFGSAILAYERALRLSPADGDVTFNLNEALKANVDKIVGAREEEPLTERIGASVPARPIGWAFIGSWLVLWAGLTLRLFAKRGRGALLSGAVLAGSVALISGTLLGLATWVHDNVRYAVVTSDVTSVREGPAKTFKTAFEIHEGLKVRVVGEQDEFERIRLPNGVEGWVVRDDVPVI